MPGGALQMLNFPPFSGTRDPELLMLREPTKTHESHDVVWRGVTMPTCGETYHTKRLKMHRADWVDGPYRHVPAVVPVKSTNAYVWLLHVQAWVGAVHTHNLSAETRIYGAGRVFL